MDQPAADVEGLANWTEKEAIISQASHDPSAHLTII